MKIFARKSLLILSLVSSFALANFAPVFAIPDRSRSRNSSFERGASSWHNLSLSQLSGALQGGSIQANGRSYTWKAGDTPDLILKLGDLEDSLAPHKFQLGQIWTISGDRPSELSLASMPLLSNLTLKELIHTVPNLGKYQPEQVKPIAALLSKKGISQVGYRGGVNSLSQLVQDNGIGNLKLSDINISKYSLASIPNTASVKVQNIPGWQNSVAASIPGLSKVPLSMMPNSLAPASGIVGRIDSVWGSSESNRTRTVSGSNRVGYHYPCKTKCAHIELNNLESEGKALSDGNFKGLSWISGKYQKVKGGSGCLKGKEPTGRHPFGKAFKVVVWDTDETKDTVDTAIFFRFKIFCGKSPYIIGPFPFLSYRVEDPIFLGGSIDN
jgi:hypothetical protein